MQVATDNYRDRDFWIVENAQYARPNFRLRKCARLLNDVAGGSSFDLLDVGCGPAALRTLLAPNISYHGIDIAVHQPAPFLRQVDFVKNPISFEERRFDIVVALGVFEYMGACQAQKMAEIRQLLKPEGIFLMSYINFQHVRRKVYPMYNNVRPIKELTRGLEEMFRVERCFPVSHHWRHKQPGRNVLPGLQLRVDWNIPWVSDWLAVEYFCLCSPRPFA